MKSLLLVSTIALSAIVAGFCEDAEAARRCRPATRRCCVGVTHQPSAAAGVRCPQLQNAVDGGGIDCTCAFFDMGGWGGFHCYYGVQFYPDCTTGYPVMMMGNYSTNNADPCGACPSSQCLSMPFASISPGQRFKPGTKLNGPQKWDEKLVLKSGQGKVKGRPFEFETKELTDANMLVSFTKGNTLHFAKLQVFRVEAQELGGSKTSTVSDFAIGHEITAPPAAQKVRDVTSQVKILDANIAVITVGSTKYQVVTATPLSE